MLSFFHITSPWAAALLIFCLRITDMSLDTMRVLFVVRGQRKVVWFLGFLQSSVFVLAITQVLSNLSNPLVVLGYAGGFATGNVVGMTIENRLAVGHVQLQIISKARGTALATSLRNAGFGVTEITARGKDGAVRLLSTNVLRKDLMRARGIVNETDSEAFITSEDVRPLWRGFWRA
jgi:uncharacterized protein YebE (UPF0316 family)